MFYFLPDRIWGEKHPFSLENSESLSKFGMIYGLLKKPHGIPQMWRAKEKFLLRIPHFCGFIASYPFNLFSIVLSRPFSLESITMIMGFILLIMLSFKSILLLKAVSSQDDLPCKMVVRENRMFL
jgi:hypothetical protein